MACAEERTPVGDNRASPDPTRGMRAGGAEPLEILARLRQRRPRVHAITNLVAMGLTVNGLLAIGAASPVVSGDPAEAGYLAARTDALLLNLGTPNPAWIPGMQAAAAAARGAGRPAVIDPVAVGMSPLRHALAKKLLDTGVTVLKGNAAEIRFLADGSGPGGIEADAGDIATAAAARDLAVRIGAVVVTTGPVDYVTDGRTTLTVHAGHPRQAETTGTGCLAGALIAACCAVCPPLEAATSALALFGAAAETAAAAAPGPGSFAVALLDALAALSPNSAPLGHRIQLATV